jgi:hypothetical protein
MHDLEPGDVLSYSAGSTQTGPEGFRKVGGRAGVLEAALVRWPEIGAALGGRTPMFINAYPATVGTIGGAITVDTYLSPRVMTRALQLGALAEKPVLVAAQPLFLADVLLRHLAAERPLPDTMLLLVGGYVMPQSLERMLVELLEPHLDALLFLHGYGAAEVDAGCMMSRERDAKGRLIYHPRPDIEVELDAGQLLLTRRAPSGEVVIERFATGDSAEALPGGGFALWNDTRLHPVVRAELESWSVADWRRRTGYVRREDERVWIQLRDGVEVEAESELDHWDFGRRFGFSWLDKPWWR